MSNLGTTLSKAREKKGLRLEEIASTTKIHVTHLQKMEKGDWKGLPPEPFIQGFLQAYARSIGMDPQKVVHHFREETGVKEPEPLQEPQAQAEPQIKLALFPALSPWKIGGALAAVVVLAVLIGLIYVGKQGSELAQNTPTPVAVQKPIESPLPSEDAIERGPERDIASTPPSFKHQLRVQSNERSWIKVVIDDAPPREFFLSEGSTTIQKAQEKMKLIVGNASEATVFYNGEPAKGREIKAGILYFVFPPGSKFPQDVPKPAKTEDDD